jgi:hypothetical protein
MLDHAIAGASGFALRGSKRQFGTRGVPSPLMISCEPRCAGQGFGEHAPHRSSPFAAHYVPSVPTIGNASPTVHRRHSDIGWSPSSAFGQCEVMVVGTAV